MLISQRIIRDPHFATADAFDLRLRVMRAKKIVVPTAAFRPVTACYSMTSDALLKAAESFVKGTKTYSIRQYRALLAQFQEDVFIESGTNAMLIRSDAPGVLKAHLIHRGSPATDLALVKNTVELIVDHGKDGRPYIVSGLEQLEATAAHPGASDTINASITTFVSVYADVVAGYILYTLLLLSRQRELITYQPTKKENQHVPKNMLPFYHYAIPRLREGQSEYTSLTEVEQVWYLDVDAVTIEHKETNMKKHIVIWTTEEREAVALRGVELFNSTARTLAQSFQDAQLDVLPEERRRSKASLRNSTQELEELGMQLYRAKRAEATSTETVTAPLAQMLPEARVDSMIAPVPTEITAPIEQAPTQATPAHIETLISSAVNALVGEFANRIEADIGSRLTETFTKLTDQVSNQEVTLNQSLANFTLRSKQLSELEQKATQMETKIVLMSASLTAIEAQYESIIKGVDGLSTLAEKEMGKFARLHDRVQADLLEMQRMLEANASAQFDASALTPAATETVTEAPTKVGRGRTPKAPANAPRVLVVGLDGDQLTILKKEFGSMLNLSFHSKDTGKKLTSMAKGADYVVMSKFVDHNLYDLIKDHPGFKASFGGMTQIKDLLLEIACKD